MGAWKRWRKVVVGGVDLLLAGRRGRRVKSFVLSPYLHLEDR
jgi:hypothetical protein